VAGVTDSSKSADNAVDLATESHDPSVPPAYAEFMRTGWGDTSLDLAPHPIIPRAAERRQQLAAAFPGERLVIPAGGFQVRSNDTDYKFRSDTAHTWLCGNQTSDAVLVIADGEATLYARPRSGRDNDEFFRDRQYGELWVGRRPSLDEISETLDVKTRHIDELADVLALEGSTRVHRGVDSRVDKLAGTATAEDTELSRVLSELRLVKDEWELSELQKACGITTLGFGDCVADWDNALQFGERWVEGTFFRRARAMGNDLGYDSIVGGGSNATVLHWIDNTGPLRNGDMVLLDMGAEGSNLYTADVTRTLPISGRFTKLQRELYSIVLEAQQAGIAAVEPGAAFRAPHEAAMAVIAHALEDLGLLPCSAQEALDPESRVYARWTLHGTSHMLGMDVHDCAKSDPAKYAEGTLEEGMVLTVEPGLYFQAEDLLVPEELRGIGIRIEDDIAVTAHGAENLSAALPRDPDEIEAWMADLRPRQESNLRPRD
jgi:Xaa-Pro aminopeptidase